MGRVITALVLIAGIQSLRAPHYNIDDGQFDDIISYRDTNDDIAEITRKLPHEGGSLAAHKWVFGRKQWEFEWFIADDWLDGAEQELQEAGKYAAPNHNAYWSLVYRELLHKSSPRLDNVAASLQRQARLLDLDRYQLASLTLAFVQYIPYKVPSNQLGLMTPPQTMSVRYGDCDTKSLLYVLLMRKLNFDMSLYISRRYTHAMAGVNVNAEGSYMTNNGQRYYFAETTAPGNRIGQLTSSQGSTSSWHLITL